jgi:hypothetical protein
MNPNLQYTHHSNLFLTFYISYSHAYNINNGLLGWEVDGNSSGSHSVTGCISDVLPLCSATEEFILLDIAIIQAFKCVCVYIHLLTLCVSTNCGA